MELKLGSYDTDDIQGDLLIVPYGIETELKLRFLCLTFHF